MTGVDIHALSGAYALDALDDIERAAFGRHLAACEPCAQEVAELQATTARLADATELAPPARLRANVLAEIAVTRQVGPAKTRSGANVNRWRRFTAGAVAAGVLAIGAGATTYVVQEQRVREAQRIEAVIGAPDAIVERVPVNGGVLSVWTSSSRDARVVTLNGLSAPDSDHAYQLWLITGQRATSAGVLDAGRGSGVRLVSGLTGDESLGVTVERAGGVDQPSTDPLATVPLKS